LKFPGSLDSTLVGRLDQPAGEARGMALFAHCFTCSKDLKAVSWISRTLAERGYSVFRFDFTGLGESEGDFAETDFSSNLEDLVSAAGFLREAFRPPNLLIGHSLGGAAVLAAAPRIPESVAVATIGAPSDTEHLRDALLLRAPDLEQSELARVRLGARDFTVKRRLLDDLAEDHVRQTLPQLGRALLIMHSPSDEVVNIDHARRLFEGARHPKSFLSLDGAGHLLEKESDARFAGEVLASWAARYLPGAD
jgi:putative redox protein